MNPFTRIISRSDFNNTMKRYVKITAALPDELKAYCPHFDAFVDPVPFKDAQQSIANELNYNIELTDEGIKRFAMLQSPYATALFRVWLLDHNEKCK